MKRRQIAIPGIVIITGEVQQGKTTFAENIVINLKKQDYKIAGFLSVGIHKKGERIGYNLFDISTSQQIKLCKSTGNERSVKIGRYFFNPKGLEKGFEILKSDNLSGKQLVVIDEIGPLELNDQGWCNAIEEICWTNSVPQLWIVRSGIVDKVIKKWNLGNVYVFNITEHSVEVVQNKLIEIITAK